MPKAYGAEFRQDVIGIGAVVASASIGRKRLDHGEPGPMGTPGPLTSS